MFKHLILSAFAAIAVTTVVQAETAAPLPFEFEAVSKDAFEKCTKIYASGNADTGSDATHKSQWDFRPNYPYFRLTGNDKPADDWLILPLVDFGENRTVRLLLSLATYPQPEDFEVYIGKNPTVEGMTQKVAETQTINTGGYFETYKFDITVPEDADISAGNNCWYVGMHINTQVCENEHKFFLSKAVIKYCEPSAPTAVSYLSGFYYKATVTMPAKDADGNALTAPMSLVVSVDGAEVQTITDCLPDAEIEVVQQLSEGNHTVSYQAVADEWNSETVEDNVTVAPIDYKLPFTFSASRENYKKSVVIDANNDKKDSREFLYGYWHYFVWDDPTFNYFASAMKKDADDWLILPLVDFESSRKVRISIEVSSDTQAESFEVWLGQECTVEGIQKIEVLKEPGLNTHYKFVTLTADVEIPQSTDGNNWCVGVHLSSPYSTYTRFNIKSIKIEKVETTVPDVQSAITDFTYSATVTLPIHNSDGSALTEAMSLVVSVDGTEVETKPDCQPGSEVNVKKLLAVGEHTITFTAKSGDTEISSNTDVVKVAQPVTYEIPMNLNPSGDLYRQSEIIEFHGSKVDTSAEQIYFGWRWEWQDGRNTYFSFRPYQDDRANDWMILPLVNVGESKKVRLTIDVSVNKVYNDSESGIDFDVWLGRERFIENMTYKAIEKTGYDTNGAHEILTYDFEIPQGEGTEFDKYWCVGIHAMSLPESRDLRVHNIKVERLNMPADPVVKSSYIADFTYCPTVTMPDKTLEGGPLTSPSLVISVNGKQVQTLTGCPAGEDVDVSVDLPVGENKVGFTVVADSKESATVTETVVIKQPLVCSLPFKFDPSEDTFGQCSVIDVDNDKTDTGSRISNAWCYVNDGTYGPSFNYNHSFSNTVPADDWIMLPLVDFAGSKKVKVTFKAAAESQPVDFEVYLGRNRTIAGMTKLIEKKTGFSTSNYQMETLTFDVEIPTAEEGKTDNLRVLGIHTTGKNALYINSFMIENADTSIPSVKSSSVLDFTYSATVTMPTTDADGNDLTGAMSLVVSADGVEIETKTECQPGADVEVSMDLEIGTHMVSYKATTETWTSAEGSDAVTIDPLINALPFDFSAKKENFDICVTHDANNDGSKWYYTQDNDGPWFRYSADKANQADDWIMFPLIDFADTDYATVSFELSASNTQNIEVYVGQDRRPDSMTKIGEKTVTDKGTHTILFKVPENMERTAAVNNYLSLGVRAVTPAAQSGHISIANVKVENYVVPVPAAPTIKSSAVNDITYTATVTMPDKDVNDEAIVLPMSLVVSIDGDEAETLTDCQPGADVEISHILTPGDHQISYKAVVSTSESEAVADDVTVAEVAALTFSFKPTSQEDFDRCVVIDVDNDGLTDASTQSTVGSWFFPGQDMACFEYCTNPDKGADDWIIFPLVDCGNSKKIKVSITMSAGSEQMESFEVYLGQTRTVEGMTTEIIKRPQFVNNETCSQEVKLPEPAGRSAGNNIWCVGLHASSPTTGKDLRFKELKIEDADSTTGIDDVVTDGSDAPVEYYNLQGVRIEKPAPGTFVIERRGNKTVKKIFR